LFELFAFQLACSGYGLAVCLFGSAALVHQSSPLSAPHELVIYKVITAATSWDFP
jgi:hypothetical protein